MSDHYGISFLTVPCGGCGHTRGAHIMDGGRIGRCVLDPWGKPMCDCRAFIGPADPP